MPCDLIKLQTICTQATKSPCKERCAPWAAAWSSAASGARVLSAAKRWGRGPLRMPGGRQRRSFVVGLSGPKKPTLWLVNVFRAGWFGCLWIWSVESPVVKHFCYYSPIAASNFVNTT